MNCTVSYDGAVGVVRIEGRLDAASVEEYKRSFAEYLGRATHFVCDLGKLDFIDSAGLGGLVSSLRRAAEKGGDLKLACLPPKVAMVFEITRAHRVFEIFDTCDAAVGSYAGRAPV